MAQGLMLDAVELQQQLKSQGVEAELSALLDFLCSPEGARAQRASKVRGGIARLAAHAIAEGRTNGALSHSLSQPDQP